MGKNGIVLLRKGITRTFLTVKEDPGKIEARGEAGTAFEYVHMFSLLWGDFWAVIKELYLLGIL